MIEKTHFRLDIIQSLMKKGFLTATDIAENLAKQGMPFRQAHELVGRMVKFCEVRGKDFEDLTEAEMLEIDPALTPDRLPDLSIAGCVNARTSFGGTAPSEVRRQIKTGHEWLDSLEKALS